MRSIATPERYKGFDLRYSRLSSVRRQPAGGPRASLSGCSFRILSVSAANAPAQIPIPLRSLVRRLPSDLFCRVSRSARCPLSFAPVDRYQLECREVQCSTPPALRPSTPLGGAKPGSELKVCNDSNGASSGTRAGL